MIKLVHINVVGQTELLLITSWSGESEKGMREKMMEENIVPQRKCEVQVHS